MSQSERGRRVRPVEISAGVRGTDEPEIDSFYESVGLHPPGRIRPRDEFLLARDGDEVVAALMYWLAPSTYDAAWHWVYGDSGRLEICELNVAPERQLTGLGRALVHSAAEIAQLNGLPYLWAWPNPNPVSFHAGRVSFFKACGFTTFEPDDEHLVMVGDTSNVLSSTARPANTDAAAHD
jgi:GNAT superfamily N-acetyltransferase